MILYKKELKNKLKTPKVGKKHTKENTYGKITRKRREFKQTYRKEKKQIKHHMKKKKGNKR